MAARRASAAAWCAGSSAGDLAGSGGRVGQPGEALKACPLIVRGGDAAPTAEKRCLSGRGVDGVDPGPAGQGVGVGGAAGIGDGLGAAEHGGGQRRCRRALRQNRGVVGVRGDGFLAATLQHRLCGPVGVALHEVGDLGRRGGAGGAKAQVEHQLFRHRIGETGGGGLRVGPAIGSDGVQGVGSLRANSSGQNEGGQREDKTGKTRTNRYAHDFF